LFEATPSIKLSKVTKEVKINLRSNSLYLYLLLDHWKKWKVMVNNNGCWSIFLTVELNGIFDIVVDDTF